MRPHIASSMQAIRKGFIDTFQRANTSTDPGVATDGSRWNVLSGTFNILNNFLNTSTSASNYPLQVVDMGVKNAKVELVASGQGAMAALWVTDAGNWWGVQSFSQPENCNCSDIAYSCNCSDQAYDCNCVPQSSQWTTCDTCSGNSCSQVQTCTYTAPYYTPGSCAVYITGYGCIVYNSGSYYAGGTSCTTDTVCTPYSYSCNCVDHSASWYSCNTCYRQVCSTCYYTACNTCYPQYFKILNSVSGVVSSIWSQAVAAVSAAFRVKTSGDVITIQAYSDSGLTSQIGSDMVYTATGSTKSTKFGLAISPSSYNQTSTVSKITIDRN